MLSFSQNYFVEHMTCSHYSKVDAVKTTIERNLVTKKREIADDKDDKGVTITSTLREVLADSGCDRIRNTHR